MYTHLSTYKSVLAFQVPKTLRGLFIIIFLQALVTRALTWESSCIMEKYVRLKICLSKIYILSVLLYSLRIVHAKHQGAIISSVNNSNNSGLITNDVTCRQAAVCVT